MHLMYIRAYTKRMKESVNSLIASELRARKLTYRAAAPELYRSFQCVGQWVSGETSPTDETLFAWLSSPTDWVRDLAFRCIRNRYPNLTEVILAAKQEEIA